MQSSPPRPQSRGVSKSLNPKIPKSQNPPRRGFTLIEMLVTVTIIGILAAMTFGALQLARESARESATKATIAKLNTIILRRYESYMTRRVPVRIPQGMTPRVAAEVRLTALREIMRMEMPDRWSDIISPAENDNITPKLDGTVAINDFSGNTITSIYRPALSRLYAQRYLSLTPDNNSAPHGYGPAECLYMLVSMGEPEAMEQFHQSEIGDVDADGYPEFIDGWGRPIMWLRFAPGFSSDETHAYSDIQIADPTNRHDPFDTRRVDTNAFHLTPLIYSAGANGRYGLQVSEDYMFTGRPFGSSDALSIGSPVSDDGSIHDYEDNITNHHIEQR